MDFAANGAWQTIQFSYTVGDSVIDNNGGAAGVDTAWSDDLLGMDIALRIGTGGYQALFDNVTVSITVIPEPSTALLGGLGLLALLRRRR